MTQQARNGLFDDNRCWYYSHEYASGLNSLEYIFAWRPQILHYSFIVLSPGDHVTVFYKSACEAVRSSQPLEENLISLA